MKQKLTIFGYKSTEMLDGVVNFSGGYYLIPFFISLVSILEKIKIWFMKKIMLLNFD